MKQQSGVHTYSNWFSYTSFSFFFSCLHPFTVRMLMLHYSKHGECILQEIGAAFRGEHPADLLLICNDKETLQAHRLVLAAASPLIRYAREKNSFNFGVFHFDL